MQLFFSLAHSHPMRIYTTAQLSERISRTPEGYLLCEGAPLARTGVMEYLPEECPEELVTGFHGAVVHLTRAAEDVFAPEAMASFEGKPLTLDHPPAGEDVGPDNWNDYARGIVFNVRRGAGAEQDLLLGDILITDADAIDAVQDGLRELSCGYDAKIDVVRPGVGRQMAIAGNHIALVAHGRAGGRCKIKDKEKTMAKAKPSLKDKLWVLLRDEDPQPTPQPVATPAATQKDETPQTGQQTAQPAEQSVSDDDLRASIEELKLGMRTLIELLQGKAQTATDNDPARDEDPQCAQDEDDTPGATDTQDEDSTATCDNDGILREGQEPGIKTTDADTVRAARRMGLLGAHIGDDAHVVRRSALALAMRDAASARIVDGVLGKKPLARASHAEIKAAFAAVSALTAASNNGRASGALSGRMTDSRRGRPLTPADINKLNADFYGKGGK